MTMPILATKLFIPPPPVKGVRRTGLIDRLNAGLSGKLTLVSASAGFGKTTLIAEWVAACDPPVAWLSLDDGDNDFARFLSHLVASLRTIEERIGESVVHAFRSAQPPGIESMLTLLLNEISALPRRIVLVLDDYHVMDAPWLDEAFAFLLDHLPPQLHLVIATRENPRFPLGRLRSRGHMTELRDADLRFAPGEAAAFLNEAMGLRLTPDEIAALETRTEGWIAGLQLAALSMRGRKDIPAFIREFAGDNHYIMDYLVEEVLRRQPEPVRDFLLRTSVLDRLSGPLCDAVTGQEAGAARLQFLERGNFFVVPLDDKRQWYRYHRLFAEVLAGHLREDRPDQVPELHRRASAWHERHGSADDAIRHALAAEDHERAADLIELALPALRRSRLETTMIKWLKPLPDELVRRRPVLGVWYAGALLAAGKPDAVEDRLRDAERCLGMIAKSRENRTSPGTEVVVVDEEEFLRLPGLMAMYRSGVALIRGDVPSAVKYARQVLDLVPADDPLLRGAATALLGLAAWRSGALEEASRMFADGLAIVLQAGSISDAINGSIALAEILTTQGRLREAMRAYERGLRIAAEHGEPDIRGTAGIYVGMSELCREFGDLAAAERHLARSEELGDRAGFPQFRYRWHVAMSRVLEARNDSERALERLREAERLYTSDFFLNARPVKAMMARTWIALGKLGEAFDWAREQGLSAADEPSYEREFEHVTLARLLLARYGSESAERFVNEAIGLLERLLQAAEAGGRTGSAIEILILQALARRMQGDTPAALVPLERALTLAEPEGYVRVFADEGRPMAALLEAALKQGIATSYARRLLTELGHGGSPAKPAAAEPPTERLSEPLSERERDVLRLLGTDLSGPEMARELTVSLNTLRTHTKNIYDKLGVNSRRTAVRRATELGLL